MACYSPAVILLCVTTLLQVQWTESVVCFGCECSLPASSSDGLIVADCNTQSINAFMASFRENDLARSIRQLTIIGAPEAVLETGVFQGLTELRILTIQFCQNLVEIQPRAFDSLTRIQSLQLERNSLEWLSVESFEGVGTSLEELFLDRNALKSLHSNLEPLFNTISDISISGNTDFVCDCHLQWLPGFIASHPVTHTGASCADPASSLLQADTYNASQCTDLCTLGYHSCSENATCSVLGDSVSCTCNPGFTGDGVQCSPLAEDPCYQLECTEHAQCVREAVSAVCVCEPGFTGNGVDCVKLTDCEEECGNSTDVYCVLKVDGGRIDCGSQQVQQLQQRLLTLSADPTLDPGLVSFSTELVAAAVNVSLPGDVPAIVDLLTLSVGVVRRRNQYHNSTFSNLVEVGSELLHLNNQPLWNQIDNTSVSDHITDLFLSIESLGEALFVSGGGEDLVISSDNIALVVATPDCDRDESITISSSLLEVPVSGGDSSLELPPTVFGTEYNCSEVGVIAVVYKGVGPLLNLDNELIPNCTSTPAPLVYGQCQWSRDQSFCPDLRVNSVIISAEAVRSTPNQTVDQLNTTVLIDPILITLRHENVTLRDPMCSFLTEEQTQLDGSWMTEGCSLVATASNTSVTVCECYHLTSFALLMSPTGPPNTDPALQIVSKIGLSISILCLFLTVILLFGLKLDTKLHHIHRQLALALGLAQLLFLVAVDRTLVPSPDALCTVIAGLLHYLFLCTFAWQLVEGVHLYLFVVQVFFNEKIVWLYYPLAWGVPLIVVGITMGLRFCDYGSEHYCWITNENGVNWAFHGPVIAVLLINIVIMVVVTTVIVRSSKKNSQDNFLLCTLLHASFVLVPILGITWVLGFFIVGDGTFSEVVEWLFCLLTATQGVLIFLMHCILNRDVRKAFLKKLGCHEAAHRQQRLTLRRSSTVQSINTFNMAVKRTFEFKRRRSSGDVTSFNTEQNMDSHGFTVARPQSSTARPGVVNPLVRIEEEGESVANSVSGTPTLSKAPTRDTPALSNIATEDTPTQDHPTSSGMNLL